MVVEPMPGTFRQGDWILLVDPGFTPPTPSSPPPDSAIVGGWQVEQNRGTGPFEPNPDYVPSSESTPTDPTDAVLCLIRDGAALGDELIRTLSDSVVEIACDVQDNPIVDVAPDGVACVLVATAAVQKQGIDAPRWWPLVGRALPDVVQPGVDIFLNPHGRVPMRLVTSSLQYRTMAQEPC
ncbi:type VII secretion system-associated protein [Nocardia sp. NPDC050710]|uniref:type VII secretion system-associated protein n=1 Tax=Nocardia sp. NPDC050710 TaxID=3157220 RepID=UPI0033DD5419